MKVAIVGSKLYGSRERVEYFINELPTKTQLVVTAMDGPSRWAEEIAKVIGMPKVSVHHIPPGKHTQDAFLDYCDTRNTKLAEESDIAVCFWDGTEANTRQIIQKMTKLGKPVFIMPDAALNSIDWWLASVVVEFIKAREPVDCRSLPPT